MTRLAVISDIHGNLPALEAVMKALRTHAPDQVVVVGDMINWGPFSAEVLEIVTAQRWSVVRGNNEYYLLDYQSDRMPVEWLRYELLPWLDDQLNKSWLGYLAGLPDSISLRFPDAPTIYVTHGIPHNPWEAVFPDSREERIAEWFGDVEETTCLLGHSHVPMDRRIGRWHLFNSGSVGVPLFGKTLASFIILDGDRSGWQGQFFEVPFDNTRVFEAFRQQDFYARCGITARLVSLEFERCQLILHPFFVWKQIHYPNAVVSHALVDAFLATDINMYVEEVYRLL